MASIRSSFVLKATKFVYSKKVTGILNCARFPYYQSAREVQTDSTSLAKDKGGQKASSKVGQMDALDLTFEDHVATFKSKTTLELLRAYIVYQLCSSNKLVEHHPKLIKLGKKIFGQKLFNYFMKATFYGHFVAGEDEVAIQPKLRLLESFGVRAIMDYSAEEDISEAKAIELELKASTSEEAVPGGSDDPNAINKFKVNKKFADRRYKLQSARTFFYLNEASCERNCGIFLKCLESVSKSEYGSGIAAIKLTAIAKPQLLLQISEVIARARKFLNDMLGGDGNVLWHHMPRKDLEKIIADAKFTDEAATKQFLDNMTTDDKGILHIFPWSGIVDTNMELNSTFRLPDIKSAKMVRLITQLSKNEEEMFRNFIKRFNVLASAAKEMNVRLMVDAEQTYFQPAIARITQEFMRKYNKTESIVYNTYQCYLKDAFNEAKADMEQAQRQGFYFGAKLVRGAYMNSERERAKEMNYPDPICENFEATTKMFHDTLTDCLQRIKALKAAGDDPKKIEIMVASHNEDTTRFTIQYMKDIGIEPSDKVISFGQLLAMCDYITFPLGQAGYSAYKYCPYGPVNEVIPYMSRRLQENNSMISKLNKEKRLALKELLRRLATGKLWYTPKGNYIPV